MSRPSLIPRPADSPNLSRAQREALTHLMGAAEYARDVRLPLWQFAVGLGELAGRGVTSSDLRWLISKGYVRHAVERTQLGAARRSFRRAANLQLPDETCFILTAAGERLAVALNRLPPPPGSTGCGPLALAEKTEVPVWDLPSHALLWRGRVIKRYRNEAPLQEAILNAFQDCHWEPCVAVCLPADDGVCLKARLHDTVKNLNRGIRPYLRFRQEGSGSRLRWEKLPALL